MSRLQDALGHWHDAIVAARLTAGMPRNAGEATLGAVRGWVAAQYLDYFYDGRYVALPSYVDAVDVPVASFVLTSYWSTYYFGRPWYRRHAWWNRHWNT